MSLANLVRTSAFRLTLLYAAVFGASVLILLAFVYWSTVAVIERQVADTIEAEIRGLAEQYAEGGVGGLVEIVRQRAGPDGDDDNVYLLTDRLLAPLAGNLAAWPQAVDREGGWVEITLRRVTDGGVVPHQVRARTFELAGGYRLLVGRDMYERRRFRDTVVQALVWSLAATLALGLAGGIFVSRRMLSRVDDISRTTARIIRGDFSGRVERRGSGDEFDRLAGSVNVMLERIERLMSGMKLATDSLAHDLRGPLTRLRGRIELALRRPADAAKDRDALADVLAEADAALAVFENLLKIATAEAGVTAADFAPVDLAALAGDAVDLYEPVAEEKAVVLELSAASAPSISGQADLLAQAVTNLLDNAVTHTPPAGKIVVSVDADGTGVALTVADSGPGIPEAERAHVLERFVRLTPGRGGRGAGLGLSLVAAVAKLHRAELTLADNNPGLRVRLRFLLPGADDRERGAGA